MENEASSSSSDRENKLGCAKISNAGDWAHHIYPRLPINKLARLKSLYCLRFQLSNFQTERWIQGGQVAQNLPIGKSSKCGNTQKCPEPNSNCMGSLQSDRSRDYKRINAQHNIHPSFRYVATAFWLQLQVLGLDSESNDMKLNNYEMQQLIALAVALFLYRFSVVPDILNLYYLLCRCALPLLPPQ